MGSRWAVDHWGSDLMGHGECMALWNDGQLGRGWLLVAAVGERAQKAEVTEEGKRCSEGVRQRALVTDFWKPKFRRMQQRRRRRRTGFNGVWLIGLFLAEGPSRRTRACNRGRVKGWVDGQSAPLYLENQSINNVRKTIKKATGWGKATKKKKKKSENKVIWKVSLALTIADYLSNVLTRP